MKKCNCDTCPLCKKAVDERNVKIGQWGLIIVFGFVVLLLAFSLGSCSPQRKFLKLVKKHPELIDSVSKIDTVHQVDTIEIRTTTTITNEILDSILSPCDPDTVVKWKIKKQIQDHCTLERKLNGEHIFRLENGTVKVWAIGDILRVELDRQNINSETTFYFPSEKCEEEKAAMIKEFKKVKRNSFLIGVLMGVLGLLFLIMVIFAVAKWGFR